MKKSIFCKLQWIPNAWWLPRKSRAILFHLEIWRSRGLRATMKFRCDLEQKNKNFVRDVNTDLCSDDLLARCFGVKTQKPIETLHYKVWNKLIKTKIYSLPTVQNVTTLIITEHNLAMQTPSLLETLALHVTPSIVYQKVTDNMVNKYRSSKTHV